MIEAATSDAPPLRHSVDDILAAGKRYQRRRWIQWSAGVLSAVMFLGLIDVIGSGGWNPERTAAPDAPARTGATGRGPNDRLLTFTFTGYTAGNLTVRDPLTSTTAYETAQITQSGNRENPAFEALLTVYRPGVYDIDALTGTATTVDGHRATHSSSTGGDDLRVRTFAWEYATDCWAVITTSTTPENDPSVADLEAVAAGFTIGATTMVRVPFTMSYVPDGFFPLMVISQPQAELAAIASSDEGVYAGVHLTRTLPTGRLTGPWGHGPLGTPLERGAIEVSVAPANGSHAPGTTGPASPECTNDSTCSLWSPDHGVRIEAVTDGAVPRSELTRILAGIRPTGVTDAGTWPDVNVAVPGRR